MQKIPHRPIQPTYSSLYFAHRLSAYVKYIYIFNSISRDRITCGIRSIFEYERSIKSLLIFWPYFWPIRGISPILKLRNRVNLYEWTYANYQLLFQTVWY